MVVYWLFGRAPAAAALVGGQIKCKFGGGRIKRTSKGGAAMMGGGRKKIKWSDWGKAVWRRDEKQMRFVSTYFFKCCCRWSEVGVKFLINLFNSIWIIQISIWECSWTSQEGTSEIRITSPMKNECRSSSPQEQCVLCGKGRKITRPKCDVRCEVSSDCSYSSVGGCFVWSSSKY